LYLRNCFISLNPLHRAAPVEKYPEAAWHKLMAVNVAGVFQLTRVLLPFLKASKSARVINVGSIDGLRVPTADTFAYSTSKAAVHHLTRVLANRLAPHRINVNCIAPGPFQSKMMRVTLERAGDLIANSCPLGRIGDDADMAAIALYLASNASAYVTGAVIPIDGGIVISSKL
jgi:NAD(P)-dependent dehydrogenase (short-subunit alcohol dehydrogenase family)